MKSILTCLWMMMVSSFYAQDVVTVNVHGISHTVSDLMKANGDCIVWYRFDGTTRIKNNIHVEISNVGGQGFDKGYGMIEAIPDANGHYVFEVACQAKKRKLDITKPVRILVKMETSLGNEVFHITERPFEKLSDPIVLDQYKWRADDKQTKPGKRLALVFSAFLNDATLRQKALEHEGAMTFTLNDFQLFLKQKEMDEWRPLGEPIEGNLTNGNGVELSNKLPSWIDPSQKIYVRFSAKTNKGNFVWGEYVVEPHEFRKEGRATGYSGKAFDASVALK
ncbi:MAG: hypothetical protein K1X54_14440 [Flavobacteriales bacterium]|nr:hypothetical protein [Flavobacteriales bacterium]